MKVAVVAAESTPWAKVGGLADVIGALPNALAKAGAQVSVVLPGYKSAIRTLATEVVADRVEAEIGTRAEPFALRRAQGERGVQIYLIDHPEFFSNRDGVYGENGRDYPDNPRRFIFFGRAAAAVLADRIHPEVIHAHDWHASVAPIAIGADPTIRAKLPDALTVFTIHNLAFQGLCDPGDFHLLGIDWSYFSVDFLEFHGRVNLMKGASIISDAASTVSPSYAREVTESAELGFGLEGVLRAKGDRFVGILNGADYSEWNPAGDPHIAARYSPADPGGKRACIADLRKRLELGAPERVPIVGMVTRMTPQKGFDLVKEALDAAMRLDLQLVILGSGDAETEAFFRDAQTRYRDRLRVVLGFDNALAHRIQAGSDAFLMPSRFEPCGLTQMYALKYGTVPIVRATGGLRDTISEFDPLAGRGNGFVFEDYRAEELVAALARAVETYRKPALWKRAVSNGFAADFSWDRAAREYLEWFGRLRETRAAA